MKIVIAPDSYKGTNSSWRVASLIEKGILKVVPDAQITKIPVADGGEGTVDAILTALGGKEHRLTVKGPLGAPKSALWGSAGDTAVMEMAEASGLPILGPEELNPLKTTTYEHGADDSGSPGSGVSQNHHRHRGKRHQRRGVSAWPRPWAPAFMMHRIS